MYYTIFLLQFKAKKWFIDSFCRPYGQFWQSGGTLASTYIVLAPAEDAIAKRTAHTAAIKTIRLFISFFFIYPLSSVIRPLTSVLWLRSSSFALLTSIPPYLIRKDCLYIDTTLPACTSVEISSVVILKTLYHKSRGLSIGKTSYLEGSFAKNP